MARKRMAATARRKTTAPRRKAKAAIDLSKELRAVGRQLDWLLVEARKAETGARVGAMRQLRQLKRSQAAANKALAKLGRQSAAASGPLVAGLQKAWRDIELAVRRAATRFRETA